MAALRAFYLWIVAVTNPMRSWKYGEDGKYVHHMLGVVSVMIAFVAIGVSYLIKGYYSEPNFVGLSLVGLLTGIAIERLQKLTGGTNTIKESVFDILHTWLGATVSAYLACILGFASLYFGA